MNERNAARIATRSNLRQLWMQRRGVSGHVGDVGRRKSGCAGRRDHREHVRRLRNAAHVALPPGTCSWAEALTFAVIDARVPHAQLVGQPSWHLMFGPWDPAHGWNSVLLDANSFRVTLVNGRAP